MPDPIRRAYVDTRRGQLHYKLCGQGRPVVLLQILPFSTGLLEGLMQAMAERGYAAHAFDLMGYGPSTRRAEVWEVADHADALAEALGHLGLGQTPIVAGHFTGVVAAEIAVRTPGWPGRLVLDGVPLIARDVAAQRLANRAELEPLLDDGAVLSQGWADVARLLHRLDPDLALGPDTQDAAFAAFSHFMQAKLSPDTSGPLLRYDLQATLQRLSCPTLVIGSATDTLRGSHEAAVALIAGARAHLFEPVHPLYALSATVERARAYLDIIDPFLRGESAAERPDPS